MAQVAGDPASWCHCRSDGIEPQEALRLVGATHGDGIGPEEIDAAQVESQKATLAPSAAA